MTKTRLEAFTDGVIAILITIMVLELPQPAGPTWTALAADPHFLPKLLAYVLSFFFIAIYWNNHHHMWHVVDRVDGAVMWANMHLLFWLSLIPWATAWLGDHPRESVPTAVYGIVVLMPAIAYTLLTGAIIRLQGRHSRLAAAIGRDVKGKASLVLYASAIGLAFVRPWVSDLIFVTVALIWLVPDRRISSRVEA